MAENQEPTGFIAGIWLEVKAFFVIMFNSVWEGFFDMTEKVWAKARFRWHNYWETVGDKEWIDTLARYKASGLLTPDDVTELSKFTTLPFPVNFLVIVPATVLLALSTVMAYMRSMMSRTQQAHSKTMRDGLPHYAEILSTALVAPEKTGEIRDIAKRHGLSDKEIDLLFLNLYRTYEEGTIRTLWLRGIIDDVKMYERMSELGYTKTRIDEIIQSWPLLPPPGDLFTMVAHEAFEPDLYKKYGLDAEFPTEQVKWLQQQGISQDWAVKYWIAHWMQPSIGQGYEMLHRDQIDKSELMDLFKLVEIPPYWREKLMNIAYMPYTRVDTRRMHKLGILNVDDVVASYKHQGYAPDKALKMAEFTVKYNAGTEKALTKSEILNGYKNGAIEKNDALGFLLAIDYTADQASYLVAYEDYKQALDLVDLQIDNIRDRFISALIIRSEAQARLDALNLPSKQVQAYLDRWELKRYFDRKLPSRSDLNKFWIAKIITDEEYVQEMTKLGYEYKYIQWYQSLTEKLGVA